MTYDILKQRQGYDLDLKIKISALRIWQWYHSWTGRVYVAFSGGLDSTVLLHLVRSSFPDVPAVFVDTGLEYPEIRDFVKSIDNVTWLRPKMTFKQVLDKYGYPVISKSVSMGISRYRKTKSDYQKSLRLWGGTAIKSGKAQRPTIPQKWHYLTTAPFEISDRCCDIMKSYQRRAILRIQMQCFLKKTSPELASGILE